MIGSKEHILRVAFLLFLQKNYREVTMKELVEKTGLSKGAFYHYFESKEKLFFEIIDSFFSSILQFDFNGIRNNSLKEFYEDYFSTINTNRFKFFENEYEAGNDDILNLNFFSLLFDAFKFFPGFREKMKEYHARELNTWKNVIDNARKMNEIETPLSDEQIAHVFIYTSDGFAMNLAMGMHEENWMSELKNMWDRFYETIKK